MNKIDLNKLWKKVKKNKVQVIVSVVAILILTPFMIASFYKSTLNYTPVEAYEVNSKVPQKIVAFATKPREVYNVYIDDTKIGTVFNPKLFDQTLEAVYKDRYEVRYPNSKLAFADNIYISKTLTYQVYENVDEQIMSYLDSQDLFSLQVKSVKFSNGQEAYVTSEDIFNEGLDIFLSNMIGKDTYQRLKENEPIPDIKGYGTRIVGYELMQTYKFEYANAPISKILTSADEVATYLSYGYNADFKFYTTKNGDTVESVARAHSLDPEQLMLINKDKIIAQNQILKPETGINVTFFKPPIQVKIMRERKESQVIEYDVKEKDDKNLEKGKKKTSVEGKDGKKDVFYNEVLTNFNVVDSKVAKEVVTQKPVDKIVKVGTKVVYNAPSNNGGNGGGGSGNNTSGPEGNGVSYGRFKNPAPGARITCGWYCYPGHDAIDFQYPGRWPGPIHASDGGTVTYAGWSAFYGYNVRINHGNGYSTLYAHLSSTAVSSGQKVSAGQKIGIMGSTGNSTGIHTHFEVKVGGRNINPCTVLSSPC